MTAEVSPVAATAGGDRPLAGVTVLDLTRLLPGNYATLLLVGLGADVIKIEDTAGGDGIRHMMTFPGQSQSAGHVVLNRGKRSVSIDLKDPAGQELMLTMVATADVLVDSFRPGVLERLGLGAQALAKVNPRLVHVSITAFGQDGPYAALPAHDLNTAGYAGLLGLVADADGTPPMPGLQNADLASGLHAALATVAGLRVAERTGRGYRADVSMAESAAGLLPLQTATLAGTNAAPPIPDYLTGALACYALYECADGKWITVAGLEPKFFSRMVDLLGHPELASDQFDPAGQEVLRNRLKEIFAASPRQHWLDLLAHEDTCVGPVLSVPEALADQQFTTRGSVTTARFSDGADATVFSCVPWDSHADEALSAPELGQDTAAVLAQVGVTAEQLNRLVEAGVVRPTSSGVVRPTS